MSKVAFFTVVYPAAERYIPDFLRSLQQQSFSDFELVIGNDGLRHLELGGLRHKTRVVDLSGTVAQIRDAGFRVLQEYGYQQAIFGDCDDYFAPNRVETSLSLLQSNDLVVNDLDLVDVGGRPIRDGYLSHRIADGDHIAPGFILDKNLCGLSNTAVRVSRLPRDIPPETVAVDWFVFATILEEGGKGFFSAATRTFYRQHGANTAGLAEQSSRQVLEAVRVKALHYRAMARTRGGGYARLAIAFESLAHRLSEEPRFRDDYVAGVKIKKKDFPLWWENALLPEELPCE